MVPEPSAPGVDEAARALLGTLLIAHGVGLRITEVEAYGGRDDPASHAYTRTPRSEIMYGPPNRLYVYRIHGHFCANVVTGPREQGSAVLIRAGEVIEGLPLARQRRPTASDDRSLARGPGNLTRALGITMDDLGTALDDGVPVCLDPASRATPTHITAGPRVGVRRAADLPWRFWITDDPTVSAYRRHARAGEASAAAGPVSVRQSPASAPRRRRPS
ncbi:DNA-3-methyladenine glycosylase [Gordonia rhizosphera]|uniref:Putative 3-methyladenine DNA glycosylase n=1 Tax=Gordonia rhizosphera NBRC 16068 TaxID=1108045 RepID=K6X307_9ACTN|nr:DNA-3-methyladenine glycosylase [Gordonia rhizosphera]GAB93184.1 putative 3-methyladenine DNA glycosylase [Gordonia rhizosphera NBRC 16068]